MLNGHTTTIFAVIAWALIHSIWQGGAVWLACVIGRRFTTDPAVRARIADVSLLMFVIAQLVTIGLLVMPHDSARVASIDIDAAHLRAFLANVNGVGRVGRIDLHPAFDRSHWWGVLTTALPWLVAAWCVVLVFALFRLVGANWLLQREIRRSHDVTAEGSSLVSRLGLPQTVRIVRSDAVSVPATAGWFRPVVLLPEPHNLPMSREEIDALTLHELAHVKRSDFAANFLRVLVCALYPVSIGIWAVARQASVDAEEAADAVAAKAYGDPKGYATTLVMLADRRLNAPLLLGASGGKLRARVTRVLGVGSGQVARRSGAALTAALVAGSVLIGIAGAAFNQLAADEREVQWLRTHDLGETIVGTLTVDKANPAFEVAFADAVAGAARGETLDAAQIDHLASLITEGVQSHLWLHDAQTTRDFPLLYAHLGRWGTWKDRRVVSQRMADLAKDATDDPKHQARLAKGALVLAAMDSVLDNGAAVRKMMGKAEFFQLMQLGTSEAYRIQLGYSLHTTRVAQTDDYMAVRANRATPQQIAAVRKAYEYNPTMLINVNRWLSTPRTTTRPTTLPVVPLEQP